MYLYMVQYQGCIKRRRLATPDTLPIDIRILDITKKNSASVCSHEYTLYIISVGESLQVLLQCNGWNFTKAPPVLCMTDMAEAPMDTPARSSTSVILCYLSSAAAEALVVLSLVCYCRCTALYTCITYNIYTCTCCVYCAGGMCIVYYILCQLFLNLSEVKGRSSSHRSVHIVYCIVCQMLVLINCSTRNEIWCTPGTWMCMVIACPLLFMHPW